MDDDFFPDDRLQFIINLIIENLSTEEVIELTDRLLYIQGYEWRDGTLVFDQKRMANRGGAREMAEDKRSGRVRKVLKLLVEVEAEQQTGLNEKKAIERVAERNGLTYDTLRMKLARLKKMTIEVVG